MREYGFSARVMHNIAAKRKCLGLTQAKVAEALGVEKESVSRLETGKIALTLERLEQFANIFGCPPIELIRDTSTEHCEQAEIIAEILKPLSLAERTSIIHFVTEATQVFLARHPSTTI